MTENEFKGLARGDLIRHKSSRKAYLVDGNYGSFVIAVNSVHATNPHEWELVSSAGHEEKLKAKAKGG